MRRGLGRRTGGGLAGLGPTPRSSCRICCASPHATEAHTLPDLLRFRRRPPSHVRTAVHVRAAQVSSLTSFDTELPYDYYSMPFCKPGDGVKKAANTANPGTILEGIRIENSPYNFTMKVSARCLGVPCRWALARQVALPPPAPAVRTCMPSPAC